MLWDFNTVLNCEERIGSVVRNSEVAPFKQCVQHCEVEDMKNKGDFSHGITSNKVQIG